MMPSPPQFGTDPEVLRALVALQSLMQSKAAEQGGEVATLAICWLTTSDVDYQSSCVRFGDPDPDILDDLAEAMTGGVGAEQITAPLPRDN